MNILFSTQILNSGIGIVRAKWPARWVNKFTEHRAHAMDESDLSYSDMASAIAPYDVVVIHKQSAVLCKVAEEASRQGKVVIYDTDDDDENLYTEYYIRGYLQNIIHWRDRILEHCDGITCTSKPLKDTLAHYRIPTMVIDNGLDLTLDEFQIKKLPYFDGLDGEWLKIVYGGSKGHSRDVEMFLRLGVIESLSEHKIDWCFYGVSDGPRRDREIGNSTVSFHPGADVKDYLADFFFNADIAIAPNIIEPFNDCRSTIKLQEAGVIGIPIVASRIESFKGWSKGAYLVDNTHDQWRDALHSLIISKKARDKGGKQNSNAVYARHNAEYLTDKRMKFYAKF